MTIRRATALDAAAIAAIWNPIIRTSDITFTTVEKTEEELTAMIAQHVVLISESDRVDGFATFGAFRDGPGYAHTAELSIYLAPHAQRRGRGATLLTALEAEARQARIHTLIAGIAGRNTGAVAFHAAQGYRQVGHLEQVGWKHGVWHDLILMQKRL